MQNADGTATCDRCGIALPGYGVLYGMVITDLDSETGILSDLIVCYLCRPAVLEGLVGFGSGCDHCGVELGVRSVGVALLVTDLDPGTPGTSRYLTFCKINGSRELFLNRLET